MKKMILLVSVVLGVCGISFLVSLSYIVETARENIDHDNPCESYQTLKWTSPFSKESKYLLGTLYAKGVCSSQDIPLARKLYESVYRGDSQRVARALFHDALQLSDFYERSQKVQNPEYIRALLAESKNLGLKPSDREIEDLVERGFVDFFSQQ